MPSLSETTGWSARDEVHDMFNVAVSPHMSISYTDGADDRGALHRLLGDLRPRLHRYTARMTGSVIDGEDVVQEAMLKAIEALPGAGPIANLEAWIFRVIHNAALDFLRRRGRQQAWQAEDDTDTIADPGSMVDDHDATLASLRTFMRLRPSHRSCVILMDVLGYAIEEITDITGLTVAAVKAALHRGRLQLRELAQEPDDNPAPILDAFERARLASYVERFNARDFDALRDLLGEDVRTRSVQQEPARRPQ